MTLPGTGRGVPGQGTSGTSSTRTSRTRTAVLAVLAVVASLLSFVVSAVPAQAATGVSTTRTVSGFPRWFEDAGGTRLEPCFENDPTRCVLLPDAGFDPAQPLAFPTNFPGEFFYSIVDSDVINTPGCAGTRPGKALVRLALEGTFAGAGTPVPGQQIVFARTRVTVSSGLCPNSTYTFTHPYGQISLTTDVDGSLARNQATTDVGCLAGGCTFTEPLTAPTFRGFLRWDPAVAPAATPGYLSGDAGVLHPIVGASGVGSANAFRVAGPGLAAPLTTNLFTVAAKVAGPLHSAPEAADFGNQPTNVPSPPRTVTFTNVSQAPMSVTGVAVTPATAPWQIAPAGPNTCTGTLAANATCSVTLVFAPTVVGAVSANLQISHTAFRNPTLLPLTGAGTAAVAPNVTSSPASLDFGRVLVGTRSTVQGVVVHNDGPGSYVVDGVTIADDTASGGFAGDAAKYLPVAGNDCPATGLAPGLSCTISVALTPADQRPTAATLNVAGHVGATSVPLSAGLAGRGGIARSSAAGGVGPAGKGADGFPTWYQDDRGVRVKQCFLNDPARCVLLAEPGFNPAAAISFPGNYPSEAFYYIADSDQMTTPGCGAASPAGRAGFRAAVEQTFTSGAVTAGEQMVFDRVRVNVTSGLCVGRQYTFVHPYGEFTFTADAQGGLPRSPGTIDTGCAPAPGGVCDFDLAAASPVSDGFLRWDATAPAPPAGFLGDAGVLHTVAGAPYTKPGASTPQNRVEIVDTTDGSVVASTNLFTVSGQVDATQTATRYTNMAPSAHPQLSAGQPVAFGSQQTGTTSAARTVTVESVGTTGLTAGAPTITGPNAGDFPVTATTCAAVPVGASCTVSVAFAPTAAGARTATLAVPSDAANGWNGTVRLTGTGTGPSVATIDATPASLAFGNQLAGTTSAARTVTVTNTGSAPLTVSGLTLGGIDGGSFAATGCSAAVAPGGTCTVSVTFRPPTAGAKAATLTIASDASNAAPVVALTGTGVEPLAAVAPTALAFAAQPVATTSAGQAVTVTNSGTAPLTVSGVTVTGIAAADFAQTNTCTAAVAPGGTCTVTVTFRPTVTGTRTATLTVASDAGVAAPTVALVGEGVQAAIAVTPTALAFGNVVVGTTTAAQTVTVTNAGTSPLTVSGLTLGGTNPAEFTASGCVAALPPGAACTVVVTFTPAATGARTATLAVASNAPGATPVVSLAGTGIQAGLTVAPAALAFGTVDVGSASAVQTVTVSNPGTAPLTVTGVSVAGTNAADFTQTNTCATAVAPGGTCTVSVTFRPSAAGVRSGSLSIASSAGPAGVPLTGTGQALAPVLAVTPAGLTFAVQAVGTTSPTQAVTVRNTGTGPLTVTAATLGGAAPADYVVTNGCTAAVAPAGTCTLTVAFRPTAGGARTASITVASDGGVGSVTLAGTATSPWVPVTGDASRYQPNLAYTATVGTSSLSGAVLSVPFTATGPGDLARPEGSCLQRVDAGVVLATVLPTATALTTNAAGSFAGTFTFPVTAAGSYVLKYACRADYNAGRVGTLSVPALTGWNPVVGSASTFASNAAYTARVTSSALVDGSWLAVGFAATGPADLSRPEATCVRVTLANGTTQTRSAAAMVLTTSAAGNYVGTAYFENLPQGTYTMSYACRPDYSAAVIGGLGVVAAPVFTPIIGQRSVATFLFLPLYQATVSSVSVTAGTLRVGFSASGPFDMARPEPTCVTITRPGGATVQLAPSSVSLTTNAPGAYAGTLTYTGLVTGSYSLRYACRADYSVAQIGTLA